MASPGVVAIIETPNSFVLEGRPDLSGKLAHAGKLQLFGGHVDNGEDAHDAIRRELGEELKLYPYGPLERLWEGTFPSQDRSGVAVMRHVSLFRVAIASAAELDLQVPSEIVEIPISLWEIKANQHQLTPFAFRALKWAVGYDA